MCSTDGCSSSAAQSYSDDGGCCCSCRDASGPPSSCCARSGSSAKQRTLLSLASPLLRQPCCCCCVISSRADGNNPSGSNPGPLKPACVPANRCVTSVSHQHCKRVRGSMRVCTHQFDIRDRRHRAAQGHRQPASHSVTVCCLDRASSGNSTWSRTYGDTAQAWGGVYA